MGFIKTLCRRSGANRNFKKLPCKSNLICILSFMILQSLQFTCSSSSKTNETKFGVWMERSPESKVAPKGDEVLFECEINITPDSIEWRFRHISVQENFYGYQIMGGNNITNDDKISKLRIYVSPDTIGEYQCVASFGTSALASVTAQLSLASISEVQNNKNDYYISQEEILRWKVAPKNSVLIKCGSVLSNPSPVWSFYKNNIQILPIDPHWPPSSIILNSITSKDSGTYSCSALNSITRKEIKLKQVVELTVDYTQRTAPHFLTQPITKVSAYPGQTVLLECPGVGNPNPKPVWSSPKVTNDHMNNNRTTILPYGLQIVNVQPDDNGTYTCRLDNGLIPVLVHIVRLEVLEKPIIIKGPGLSLANESHPWELECLVKGNPAPVIYWMINGVDTRTDNSITQRENTLIISKMKKVYAGIVQCFAKNDAGVTVSSNLLQVNPQQVNSSVLGQLPTQSTFDHKPSKQKKKHKSPTMVPPNKPSVSRLSDDSVMLRWSVPKNDGLDITFFKVQYKMLDRVKPSQRSNWQTTNEEINFGKRDNKMRNFTIPVSGLQSDHYYRFRILAVYSNNDNKEGPSTGKFLLQSANTLGKEKGFLPAPILTAVEGITETAILLHWDFPDNIFIDGFYVHYRSVLSAGDYTKQTIEGMKTRKYKIDNLEANTAYEFKLQSFTLSAASDFSVILTGRTMKLTTSPPFVKTISNIQEQQTIQNETYYTVIAGTAGGSILLLLAVIAVCVLYRRKHNLQNDEDKPNIDHIQADGHLVPPMHKNNHRLNGVMNITPNPLAHEGDKNRNVMELRYLPTMDHQPEFEYRQPESEIASRTGEMENRDVNERVMKEDNSGTSNVQSQNVGATKSIRTHSPIEITKSVSKDSSRNLNSMYNFSTNTNELNNSCKNKKENNINLNNRNQRSPTPPPIPPHQHHNNHNHHHYQPNDLENKCQQQQQQSQQPPLPAKPHHLINLHSQVQQQQQQQRSSPYHHFNQQNSNSSNSPTPLHKQQQHHSNNHHKVKNNCQLKNSVNNICVQASPITPDYNNHRILNKSNRNLHYSPPPPIYNTTMPIDDLSNRVPSLRAPRYTSCNENIGIAASPKFQRSPKPVRALPSINRNHMGNLNDNMSSGSLNSIEV